MPSQYLGMDPQDVDHQAERAFLLACAMKTAEMRKQQAKKNKVRKR